MEEPSSPGPKDPPKSRFLPRFDALKVAASSAAASASEWSSRAANASAEAARVAGARAAEAGAKAADAARRAAEATAAATEAAREAARERLAREDGGGPPEPRRSGSLTPSEREAAFAALLQRRSVAMEPLRRLCFLDGVPDGVHSTSVGLPSWDRGCMGPISLDRACPRPSASLSRRSALLSRRSAP